MKKRGISLIVLIITIIVVIILAAVVILTLSKNNPIESAKEARFKEDVRTFQDELALSVSKEYAKLAGQRDTKISTSDFDEIKEYIPSFSEKYRGKFEIYEDELVYTKNVTKDEEERLLSLNIKKNLKIIEKLKYISNGMVLLFDGENNTRNGHNDLATVWEDLSGNNNDGEIINGSWEKNSINLRKSEAYVKINNVNNFPVGNSPYTLEVIFKSTHLYEGGLINIGVYEQGGLGNAFRMQEGGFKNYYWGNDLVTQSSILVKNNIYSALAINYGNDRRIYLNGSMIARDNKTPNVVMGDVTIGKTYSNEYICGDIYCVRIYNRALSEEEIKHNYEVDKARFGI